MDILFRDLLDVIDANIAIIDFNGNIVAVNGAWKRFAQENGGDDGTTGEGVNYLEVCRRASDPGGITFYDGLVSLLDGRQERFRFRYPCHAPNTQRYFVGTAKRIDLANGPAILITHEDVTDVLLEERAGLEKLILAKATVETSHQAILSFELWGGVVDANPAACHLFGYPEDGMGNEKFDLLFPDAAVTPSQLAETCRGSNGLGQTCCLRYTICTRDIKRVPVEARVDLIELGERPILVFMLHVVEPQELVVSGDTQPAEIGNSATRLPDGQPEPAGARGDTPRAGRDTGDKDFASETKPTTRCSVLIVEDEQQIRELNKTTLARRGHTVIEARDGVEALIIFLKRSRNIDLIITDYEMPRMDGYILMQLVRRVNAAIPILFLSGKAQALSSQIIQDERTMIQQKPCRADSLNEYIDKLMNATR